MVTRKKGGRRGDRGRGDDTQQARAGLQGRRTVRNENRTLDVLGERGHADRALTGARKNNMATLGEAELAKREVNGSAHVVKAGEL